MPSSCQEIGEFWDKHDTADYWNPTYPVEFTINLDPKSQVRYYGIERNLSGAIYRAKSLRSPGKSQRLLLYLPTICRWR